MYFSSGPSVLWCGRCWRGKYPTKMWTPLPSSGEWATTVYNCPYLKAVQTASSSSWDSAGKITASGGLELKYVRIKVTFESSQIWPRLWNAQELQAQKQAVVSTDPPASGHRLGRHAVHAAGNLLSVSGKFLVFFLLVNRPTGYWLLFLSLWPVQQLKC